MVSKSPAKKKASKRAIRHIRKKPEAARKSARKKIYTHAKKKNKRSSPKKTAVRKNSKREKFKQLGKGPKEEEFYIDEDENKEEPFPLFDESEKDTDILDSDEPGYDFEDEEGGSEDEEW